MTPSTNLSNINIQADLNKLKMLLLVFGDVISVIENSIAPPKVPSFHTKGMGRKFHGKPTKARPVAVMNPSDNKIISEHVSLTSAAESLGVSLTSIWKGCKNPDRIVVGHKFNYLDIE